MRVFNIDSPLMVFLGRVADLMILNLMVVLLCIPVITMGPAMTAMHYVLLKMARKEECYIVAPFFKSFKENFVQATIIGVIIILITAVFIMNFMILSDPEIEFARWMRIALMACALLGVMTLLYIFPLLARFRNTIRGTFKNALFMSILHLPRTVLMMIFYVIPLILIIANVNLIPVVFLLGIAGPAYGCAMLYSGIFKRFEPEEEQIDADAWTVDLTEAPKTENKGEGF